MSLISCCDAMLNWWLLIRSFGRLFMASAATKAKPNNIAFSARKTRFPAGSFGDP